MLIKTCVWEREKLDSVVVFSVSVAWQTSVYIFISGKVLCIWAPVFWMAWEYLPKCTLFSSNSFAVSLSCFRCRSFFTLFSLLCQPGFRSFHFPNYLVCFFARPYTKNHTHTQLFSLIWKWFKRNTDAAPNLYTWKSELISLVTNTLMWQSNYKA